jgi:ribonuclease M5
MDDAGGRIDIQEVIVVEGIHDKQLVERAVRAEIVVLGGDRVSKATLNVIRRAVRHRGVIVLTDPDGAGERIRRRIDAAVPGCKHAYVPRALAINDGGLGIEHTKPEHVLKAVLRARPSTVEKSVDPAAQPFTMADMVQHGLVGADDAADRRTKVGQSLGIGYGNAKAFLHKLNTLGVTRAEWEAAIERLR